VCEVDQDDTIKVKLGLTDPNNREMFKELTLKVFKLSKPCPTFREGPKFFKGNFEPFNCVILSRN